MPVKILHTKQICQRLGISSRTFQRRLASGWKDGHGFFIESTRGGWCIKESDLELLIEGIQMRYFQDRCQREKSLKK
ncbi:MAG: hypothetical protein NC324_02225 [Bacteroides sp.]|nr:hypothetical protein [Bacteroides sp.]